jgi:hypothetical protein
VWRRFGDRYIQNQKEIKSLVWNGQRMDPSAEAHRARLHEQQTKIEL